MNNITIINKMNFEIPLSASFDIECESTDVSFPQPQNTGDKIVQICVTYSKLEEVNHVYKHLLSLDETLDIEDVITETFQTEEELILGFTELMKNIDPEIVTGYNFDFNYLVERKKKLGIEQSINRIL
jgi:DNA polymerase delta subunit 1